MKELGIYVHIPFCTSKCAYCDFYSRPLNNDRTVYRYTEALCRQISEFSQKNGIVSADTVFIGGGTPTSLPESCLSEIFKQLNKSFHITPNTEFTCESNPKSFTGDKLYTMMRYGLNRLSIGIQSAVANELSVIGRTHSFEDAIQAFEIASACSLKNINADIMYGLPCQTVSSFEYTLNRIAQLSPTHVSVYGLQLEKGTALYNKRASLVFPSEDEEYTMNKTAKRVLSENGYTRYEISNYAKPGFRCRHNLRYWNCMEYIGFGVAAHSFIDNTRYYCRPDTEAFCSASDFPDLMNTEERLTESELEKEYAMLRLRLCDGLQISKNHADLTRKAQKYISAGYMRCEGGFLFFTDDGFDVSNTILSDLIFD